MQSGNALGLGFKGSRHAASFISEVEVRTRNGFRHVTATFGSNRKANPNVVPSAALPPTSANM